MVNLKSGQCTGCMACLAECPVGALDVIKDSKGNDFIQANTEKCINCGKCDRVCPIVSPIKHNLPKRVYAATAKNDTILKSSSSGGAAFLIAQEFIKQGGIVYGGASTSISHIEHIAVDNVGLLPLLSGSKYVQSDISHIFKGLRNNLKNGKKVLFIGTPCQAAAVINFAANNENLFCIDLVCHGEPSIGFLKRYAHETLDAQHTEKCRIEFRRKNPKVKFGTWFVDATTEKDVKRQPYPKSPYMAAFFAGLCYRENCHNCIFAKPERVSDLTLGDFWGLESNRFDEQKGVSLIMCNSEKGISLFDLIKNQVEFESQTLEKAIAGNANLKTPFKRPLNKDQFYACLQNHTIEHSVKINIPSYKKENNLLYQLYLKIAVFSHKLLKGK